MNIIRATFLVCLCVYMGSACSNGSLKKQGFTCENVKYLFDTAYNLHVNTAISYPKSYTQDDSRRILQKYIEVLDPSKMYFYKADVQNILHRYEDVLFQRIQSLDCSPIYDVYLLWSKRVHERRLIMSKLLSHSYDFSLKEYLAEYRIRRFVKRDFISDRVRKVMKLLLYSNLQGTMFANVPKNWIPNDVEKNRLRKYFSIDFFYAERAPEDHIHYQFMKAVYAQLGPHTTFLPPYEVSRWKDALFSFKEGIGIYLKEAEDGARVEIIYKNGPADKEGTLKVGDIIVAIKQKQDDPWLYYQDASIEVFSRMLSGKQNTEVYLLVRHNPEDNTASVDKTEKHVVVLTRNTFTPYENHAPYYHTEMTSALAKDHPITLGYIYIPAFKRSEQTDDPKDLTEGTAYQVSQAIQSLVHEENADVLVLDLRDNGGGISQQASHIVKQLSNPDVIRYTREIAKDESEQTITSLKYMMDTTPTLFLQTPIVILVNRASASASEVVSQALKAHNRAIIVGDPNTYGKGTEQSLFLPSRSNGYGIKVTTGYFYGADGTSVNNIGVASDIIIPSLTAGRQTLSHSYSYQDNNLSNPLPAKYHNTRDLRFRDEAMITSLEHISKERAESRPMLRKAWDLYDLIQKNTSYTLKYGYYHPLRIDLEDDEFYDHAWTYREELEDQRQSRELLHLKLRYTTEDAFKQHMQDLLSQDFVLAEAMRIAADYYVLCKLSTQTQAEDDSDTYDEENPVLKIYLDQGCQPYSDIL